MHPKRAQDIESRLLPDGYLALVSTQTDWAYTLNPPGALVWEFCDGELSADEIADRAAKILGADPLQFACQAQELIAELANAGVILTENK